MNILFLHNNFPAQFRHLAAHLAAQPEHRVFFLSHYCPKDAHIPGVHWRQVPLPPRENAPNKPRTSGLNLLACAEYFGNALLELRREGVQAHVVCGHPGFGCCLYAPDIFPEARHVGYFEWYHSQIHTGCAPARVPALVRMEDSQRNMPVLAALTHDTAGICPTLWQRDQHPPLFHHKLHVLHDGVDTDFFSPRQEALDDPALHEWGLHEAQEIVTFATRSLDKLRGFHTFYHSLPRILAERPKAHIAIMGDTSHSYAENTQDKGWLEDMLREVKIDKERVHMLPLQSYERYRALLRASSLHVYLTAPFVLSWSMLEAMSCGCLVLGADTPPVREVLHHQENGLLATAPHADALAQDVVNALEHREQWGFLRTAARQSVLDHYDLKKLLPQHRALVLGEKIY